MKLILTNFRCYTEREFDFGKNGVILLTGPSGCGKTTMLVAINFVLYNVGQKLSSFGKKSCKVVLEFEEMTITRTRCPNIVTVQNSRTDEKFESDSAQAVINTKFGLAFDVISYVQQNTINSFVMMNPADKLEFLEKFAFHDIKLQEMKARCKSEILRRHDELIATTAKLESDSKYLENMQKPEKVEFPFEAENQEEVISALILKIEKGTLKIKKIEETLNKLKKEYNQLSILEAKKDEKKKTISNIEKKLETLFSEKSSIQYDGDDNFEEIQNQLKALLSKKELVSLQKKCQHDEENYNSMCIDELRNMENLALKKREENWKKYSKQEIEESCTEYKKLCKDSETKQRLLSNFCNVNENEITTMKTNLEITKTKLIRLESYECPSCNAILHFNDGKLVKIEGLCESTLADKNELLKTISTLEIRIPKEQAKVTRNKEIQNELEILQNSYEDDIPPKNEIEQEIETLQQYKRAHTQIEQEIKQLTLAIESKTFSNTLNIVKNKLEQDKKRLSQLTSKVGNTSIEMDEESLRSILESQKRSKERLVNIEKNIEENSEEIQELQEELKTLENAYIREFGTQRDNITHDISETENELKKLKVRLVEYNENMRNIEKYKVYKKEYDEYKVWAKRVKNLKKEEQYKQSSYSSALILKEKILNAESIAIRNIVDSINIHAQGYLDIFFPTYSIEVILSTIKEQKKVTKPQINLQINYKDIQADISMLSGGELSRVVLAYTLALAEIFNSPLILLDECTASLDQDLTSIVIEGIRKNFPNKMVIVIAHQIVQGNLDRVIQLS